MEWYKTSEHPPPQNIDILGLSSEGRFKVVNMRNGKFDTFWEIVKWAHLPTVSKDDFTTDGTKKKQRIK